MGLASVSGLGIQQRTGKKKKAPALRKLTGFFFEWGEVGRGGSEMELLTKEHSILLGSGFCGHLGRVWAGLGYKYRESMGRHRQSPAGGRDTAGCTTASQMGAFCDAFKGRPE
jgi:hypothetical protein